MNRWLTHIYINRPIDAAVNCPYLAYTAFGKQSFQFMLLCHGIVKSLIGLLYAWLPYFFADTAGIAAMLVSETTSLLLTGACYYSQPVRVFFVLRTTGVHSGKKIEMSSTSSSYLAVIVPPICSVSSLAMESPRPVDFEAVSTV